ncbi:hypothetical protein ANCCAN_27823, partial [Ancylostoma caninum]
RWDCNLEEMANSAAQGCPDGQMTPSCHKQNVTAHWDMELSTSPATPPIKCANIAYRGAKMRYVTKHSLLVK